MEKLLTFEFDNVTREVELIINKIGAKYMIDILENFINISLMRRFGTHAFRN